MKSYEHESVQRIGMIDEEQPFVYIGKLYRLSFKSDAYAGKVSLLFGYQSSISESGKAANQWFSFLESSNGKRIIRVEAQIAEGPWMGFWLASDLRSKEILIVDPNSVRLAAKAIATPGEEIDELAIGGISSPMAPDLEEAIMEIMEMR